MPSIRVNNSPAGTSNAVDGLQFQDVPPGGALVTIYASTAVAGGSISYSVGTERFLVACNPNVESAVFPNALLDLCVFFCRELGSNM